MSVKLLSRRIIKFLVMTIIGIFGSNHPMAELIHYSKEHPFVAEMYSAIPGSISPDKIGSSSQYSLLLHLVRTPVRFSKDLQIEADLLESWKILDENKKYILTFKKNQHFSNGDLITAKFFKSVLDWHIKKKSSIHFDFSKIKKTKLVNDLVIEIQMNSQANDFIRQLVHPEFGLYYKLNEKIELSDFKVTSGPFSVVSTSSEEILMKKNEAYPSDIIYPEWVSWKSSGAKKQLLGLKNGEVDFSIPHQEFGVKEHNVLLRDNKVKSIDPNVGYTFFISLNPNSKNFDSVEKRRSFLKFLSNIKLDLTAYAPMWEKASQLYLKGGLGRPSNSEIEETWEVIKSSRILNFPMRIKVLLSEKFNFASEFIQFLKSNQIEVDVTKYKDFDEYSDLIKISNYDLMQVNNDFSSVELLENLLVTFRESRPLIFTENNQIRDLLKQAEEAETVENKSKIIKIIGIKLLTDAYIFPIAHYKKFAYAKKNISFKNWSILFPDMRIYKIELENANTSQ